MAQLEVAAEGESAAPIEPRFKVMADPNANLATACPGSPKHVFVVFTPTGKRGWVQSGTTILEAARALGVDLDSVCGGRAICGRCQVAFSVGEHPKFQITAHEGTLSPLSSSEQRYAQRRGLIAGRRLGCSATLLDNSVIDVPPESQVHRQVIRKPPEPRDIVVDPVTQLHYVTVRKPDMREPLGDFRRLCQDLRAQSPNCGISDEVTCDLSVLQQLQKTLRADDWKVTVALRNGNRVIGVWPGFGQKAYGLAVDIGSTTMAADLCDLESGEVLASAGTMNPQIRFGEDLMSRVSYIMTNPGSDAAMTKAVRDAVNFLATETTRDIGARPDEIVELVLVGNPIMHHLFLGIDPTELGSAPFATTIDASVNLSAAELDLYLHPGAQVYALPCIAGHVGADTAAMILSESPHRQDGMMLLIDVGTNAEIVLGNRERLVACSSPTGPAFEGAQISAGQRAAPGAIERVRIDPETLEPCFKVIGSELWSDNASFEPAIASSGITGICGTGIIEVLAEMYLTGILSADGVISDRMAARSERVFKDGRTYSYRLTDGVTVTQKDVREVQLAKAALHAGFQLLMDQMGIEFVDRVILAGAFGSHIDTKYAMVLGMVPDCNLTNVWSVGNAAGTGARIALLNGPARREIERVVLDVEKIETAMEPRFQEHFVDAMAFPHKNSPYARLRAVVSLPAQREGPPGDLAGKRRRRRR